MKEDIKMANKKNKVKFNICNVHYAPITVAEEGTVSFGTPVPMPVQYPSAWIRQVSRNHSMPMVLSIM